MRAKRGFLLIVLVVILSYLVLTVDTTPPTITLNTSLPNNVTSNETLVITASFFDDDGGFVGNITLNELSDGSTSKNLTFTEAGNQTVYLKILKNANVINATMNITGYTIAEGNEHLTGYSGDWTNIANAEDGDWSTAATVYSPFGGGPPLYVNYSYDYVGRRNWTYKFSLGGSARWITLLCYNYSDSSWFSIKEWDYRYWNLNLTVTDTIPNGCLQNPIQLKVNPRRGNVYYFEGNITSVVENTTNPYLEVGTLDGTHEWNYSGIFNGTNTTLNLASAINSNLSGCSADNLGYCLVSLLFHLDSGGLLEISNINITYQGNQSCEVCITSDGTCDSEWTISNVTTSYNSTYLGGNCSFPWNVSYYNDALYYNISFRIRDISSNTGISSKNITLDRNAPTFEEGFPLNGGAFNINRTNANTTGVSLTFSYYPADI